MSSHLDVGQRCVIAEGGKDLGNLIWSGGNTVRLLRYDPGDDTWLCCDDEGSRGWVSAKDLDPVVTDNELQTAIDSIRQSAAGKTMKHCPTCTCGQTDKEHT